MVESGRAIRAGTRCSVDVAKQRIESRGTGEGADGNPTPPATTPTPRLAPGLLAESMPSSVPTERPLDLRPKRDQRHASAGGHSSDGAGWRELERAGQFDA